MLGGGRSWYEKLPCENACLAIWFASWNVFVGNFISNISVKMSDSDCKFVHFS